MKTLPHKRRSALLPHYDCGQPGAYFTTACVKDRKCALGKMVGEEVVLAREGEIVRAVWEQIPDQFENVALDEFVAMPSHVHGILWISGTCHVGAHHAAPLPGSGRDPRPKPGSLGAIVRSFKSAATKQINQLHSTPGTSFWQPSYYEHIIRDDDDLQQHRKYMQENPPRWTADEYYREANYA